MINLLADYSDAGAALAPFIILLWIFGFIYGIVCFFIPFMIYAVMSNTRKNNETLRKIEELLKPKTISTR
jgi:hypothetical protein